MLNKFLSPLAILIALTSTTALAKPTPASMKPGYPNNSYSSTASSARATPASASQNFNWVRPAPAAPTSMAANNSPVAQHAQYHAAQQPVQMAGSPQPVVNNNMPVANSTSDAENYGVVAGPRISTLGYGAEAGIMMNDNLGARANLQYVDVTANRTNDGIKYKGSLEWLTAGALLDYYPSYDSGFRVSGGVFVGDNNVDLVATPTNNVNIGGTTYTPVQVGSIIGDVKTNMLAPYLGLGYNSLHQDLGNWNFSMDLGVKYNGEPDVKLRSTNGFVSQSDLDRESKDVQDQLDLTKFYPVAGITVGYKF